MVNLHFFTWLGVQSLCLSTSVDGLEWRGGNGLCVTSLSLNFGWNFASHKILAEVKATMIEVKEMVISMPRYFRELGGLVR